MNKSLHACHCPHRGAGGRLDALVLGVHTQYLPGQYGRRLWSVGVAPPAPVQARFPLKTKRIPPHPQRWGKPLCYPDISDTLKRGSGEMRHSRKHKKTATVRDNDGMRCEAAAVRGSFSSVGAKHIKCNNIIIYIKTPHSRKGLLFGRICWIS